MLNNSMVELFIMPTKFDFDHVRRPSRGLTRREAFKGIGAALFKAASPVSKLAIQTTSDAIAAAAAVVPKLVVSTTVGAIDAGAEGARNAAKANPPNPVTEKAMFDELHPFSTWISTRANTLNQWCCSPADGRPAQVRFDKETGTQQAYIAKEVYGNQAPDKWLDIPTTTLVAGVFNGPLNDEDGHVIPRGEAEQAKPYPHSLTWWLPIPGTPGYIRCFWPGPQD